MTPKCVIAGMVVDIGLTKLARLASVAWSNNPILVALNNPRMGYIYDETDPIPDQIFSGSDDQSTLLIYAQM